MLPFCSVTLIYSFEEWGSPLERGVFTHSYLSCTPAPRCSFASVVPHSSVQLCPSASMTLFSLVSSRSPSQAPLFEFLWKVSSSPLLLSTLRISVITFIQTTSTPTSLPWLSWAPFIWSWRSAWCPALSTTSDTLFRHLPEPLLSSWCPTLNKIHQGLPTAYRNSLNSSLGFKI